MVDLIPLARVRRRGFRVHARYLSAASFCAPGDRNSRDVVSIGKAPPLNASGA
jgi:hypothetical protein